MIAPPGRMRRAAGPSLLTKTGRCSKAKSRAVTTTAIHHPSPLKARLDEPIQVTSSMKWPEQSEALRAPLCRHRFWRPVTFSNSPLLSRSPSTPPGGGRLSVDAGCACGQAEGASL